MQHKIVCLHARLGTTVELGPYVDRLAAEDAKALLDRTTRSWISRVQPVTVSENTVPSDS